MKRPKNAADRHTQKTVSFRLPERLTALLRVLAQRNRRTLSGETQIALENHLAVHGLLPGPTTEEVDGKDISADHAAGPLRGQGAGDRQHSS
jgi:hypothetical protein